MNNAQINDYQSFLQTKIPSVQYSGFEISEGELNPILFDWQKKIVQWALKLGKAALFMECGTGKGGIQLEWSYQVARYTGQKALICAPLAVAKQMLKEARKFGYEVEYCRSQQESDNSLCSVIVTNYEMLKHFDALHFGSLSIDESSILKNYTGKTKRMLFQFGANMRFKLAPTATPAPNDHLELGNHAEFLDVMDSNEMIARWFINDAMEAGSYRLKEHGATDFWNWVASWAVCLTRPSDLGYPDGDFILPPLEIVEHTVNVDHTRAHASGQLMIGINKLSSTNMWAEKRATLADRCQKVVDLVLSEPTESWIVWYDTDEEAQLLHTLLPGSLLVQGKHSLAIKEDRLNAFSDGLAQVIITHRKIAGLGLNWQHCARMTLFGTYSFESVYQALRRSWRYGQTRPVVAHVIAAESEFGILDTLKSKQIAHAEMQANMSRAMRESGLSAGANHVLRSFGSSSVATGPNYALHLGDAVQILAKMPSNSVDGAVDSSPFKAIYIYSPHFEDLGNCASTEEFCTHYTFLLTEQFRVMKSGARHATHCKDLPLYQNRDDAMGLDDFPGDIIKCHEAAGFRLTDWLTVWKDPVIEMQRTKNAGLLWSSAFCQRAERARQGMADYVLIFEKPDGTPEKPIQEHWGLPKSVVERCVDLWTNSADYRPWLKSADELLVNQAGLIIADFDSRQIDETWIQDTVSSLMDGRLLVCHVCDSRLMHLLVDKMKPHRMVFHSRVALTDGSWLVVFRKWVAEMPDDTHVTHDLVAPRFMWPTEGRAIGEVNPEGHKFVGNQPPTYYDSSRDYSIQVWQRYASPVWFDLDGLPESHADILMNIDQTNVLNHRLARESQDEKHICPLQLDLIQVMIKRVLAGRKIKGQAKILSTFAGIGSEGVEAIKAGHYFIGCELKHAYWVQARRFLNEAELSRGQIDMFAQAGITF